MLDRYDVLVLGAGVIGVSTALHLQARGKKVAMVDFDAPGNGTSYGNAGLIERASVTPYGFPRKLSVIMKYALNRQPDMYYKWSGLLANAPWLWRFWKNSAPKPLMSAAQDMLPLIERSVSEHAALITQANLQHLVRKSGWIEVFRSEELLKEAVAEAEQRRAFGLEFHVLDAAALQREEPALKPLLAGGIHWQDPWTLNNPQGLVQGYAQLFQKNGGVLLKADANGLSKEGSDWVLPVAVGKTLAASQLVIALGSEGHKFLRRWGYRLPVAIKRGYHLHFAVNEAEPFLQKPVCETAGGYVLSPMNAGIRLTTGIEFALDNAPPDLTQIKRATQLARELYGLGEPIETVPWMGRRGCTPDMRPIIGQAPHHQGLWINIGHNHHGMTLGPACGRLLAEMMTGEIPFTDPVPYRVARF